MPEVAYEERAGPRALWSGTLSFGLVSIPVNLFPATHEERFSLRMLSPEGTPLARELCCPEHDEAVPDEEIVRGFEAARGEFVRVSEEELERLAPRKSRDIDLRSFVPRAELPMLAFQRAHFMTPASESNKAYRLLAEVLESTGRAGIATFVLRGKEYLVAILSEAGLLRAETLRFADELRTPADVGLPSVAEPNAKLDARFTKAVQKLQRKTLDASELEDRMLAEARALVRAKQRRNQDVVRISKEQLEASRNQADIIDLMEVLKRSLEGRSRAASTESRTASGGSRRRAS